MDYIAKFAKEFSDHASLKTSTTRAYNLFTKSNMPLGAFIAVCTRHTPLPRECFCRA
jgi:hypothetical protein